MKLETLFKNLLKVHPQAGEWLRVSILIGIFVFASQWGHAELQLKLKNKTPTDI